MSTSRIRLTSPAAYVALVLLCTVCVLVIGIQSAQAQSSALPTVDEVVGKLGAVRDAARAAETSPVKKTRKTRGIEFTDDADKTQVDSGAGGGGAIAASSDKTPPASTSNGVGGYSESRIQFEFNSDRLTEFARNVLDVFATAIQTPGLKDTGFVIEGHTDGVGNDAYNQDLSRKRADAVVRYLTEVRGISMDRLAARGKGKRELINKTDPAAAENRRVVWLAMR